MTEIKNNWLQFLADSGARLSQPPQSAAAEVLGFGDGGASDPAADFVAPLTDLGLIAATGSDAATFLHSQLTNDVEHLGLSEARLAGYCSPKGRLLATMLIWKSPDAILLQLPREIQAAVQKRLQMFILRSKAKLADASDNHVALGLVGHGAQEALSPRFSSLPLTPYAKIDADAGTLIRVADAGGLPRYQWITTPEIAQDAWPELTRSLRPVGTRLWRLSDIRAGIPQIRQVTQEQFVPQMINFEAVGGVNFRKGCYPGQEIVARSQYLGKLKRRMLPATVDDAAAKAGMEVFASTDPEQPCGMVVNAEPVAEGRSECLVEFKTAALDGATEATIHLGSTGGAPLRFGSLPYALPEPA